MDPADSLLPPQPEAAMRLSTQLHRSLFALPLLMVGLAAVGLEEAATSDRLVPASLAEASISDAACASAARPAGPRGLARMPGDIGALGRRLRCAS